MYKNRLTEQEMRAILASNLCYLRRSKKGISQEALARTLTLSRKTIMNYEAGKVSPAAYVVFSLAGYYGCTMEELLTKELYRKDGQ